VGGNAARPLVGQASPTYALGMPTDGSRLVDVVALWPLAAGVLLGLAAGLPGRLLQRRAALPPFAGIAAAVFAADGLWAWMLSGATWYADGSTHLDHAAVPRLAVAGGALVAALAATTAAVRLRPPAPWVSRVALALCALACVAQSFGFLAYADGG
jgi:hypothetical protein